MSCSFRQMARQFGIRGRIAATYRAAVSAQPRRHAASGTLAGGQALRTAQVVDATIGQGHVVMFAIRAVLAMADAGDVFPGLQHDPELERSRRGKPADGDQSGK